MWSPAICASSSKCRGTTAKLEIALRIVKFAKLPARNLNENFYSLLATKSAASFTMPDEMYCSAL